MAARAAQALTAAAVVAAILAAAPATAMTTEEAYAAIPHRRTSFETSASKAPAAQSESLQRLFAYTDRGVVLRVQGMAARRNGDAVETKRVLEAYGALIAELRAARVAPEVAAARDKVVEALELHRSFVASRPPGFAFARKELASTPEVARASGNLQGAYGMLMRAFPGEIPKHKQSFFDHLCALDFL
jgi:hypothetical protein